MPPPIPRKGGGHADFAKSVEGGIFFVRDESIMEVTWTIPSEIRKLSLEFCGVDARIWVTLTSPYGAMATVHFPRAAQPLESARLDLS